MLTCHCEHVGTLILAFSSKHRCAKVQPRRAASMAVGDGESCLEALNTKEARTDLVQNNKTESNRIQSDAESSSSCTHFLIAFCVDNLRCSTILL